MFLEVRPSNAAAIAMYRKHGFQAIRRRKAIIPASTDARMRS